MDETEQIGVIFEFTEATTIRIFLTLRSVEEKSTDSTVRECKKK